MRAEGRGSRSELPDLLSQLTSLDAFFARVLTPQGEAMIAGSPDELRRYAILFQAEALAQTILRLLKALSFEARLGIPKNELELLTLFQNQGFWSLAEGRRLRQFLELRNLSSRNIDQIDEPGIEELLHGRQEWITLMRDLHGKIAAR